MKKFKISRHGMRQTLSDFTGIKATTIADWIARPVHPNYELCHKIMDELVEAQNKVLVKWSTNKRLVDAVARTKTRKKRSNVK